MGVKKYLYSIFAAMAVMILMAFVGAGSASATVLCNGATTSGCTSYGKGAIVDGSFTESATLSTTEGTLLDTCAYGGFEGKTNTAGGSSETVKETIEELSWGSCSKTTDTINKGELEFHWISGTDNATVTGKNISVTANTAFGSCTYGTGESADLGTLKGGTSATIQISAVLSKTAGGFTCPSAAKWAASYTVTSPQPLYIGESSIAAAPLLRLENSGGLPKPNTRICEFEIKGNVCNFTIWNDSTFPVIVTLEEVTPPLNRYNIINEACKKKTELAKEQFCTAEVQLIVNKNAEEPPWFNGYLIKAEEKGSNGGNLGGITGQLSTK